MQVCAVIAEEPTTDVDCCISAVVQFNPVRFGGAGVGEHLFNDHSLVQCEGVVIRAVGIHRTDVCARAIRIECMYGIARVDSR